MHCEILGPLRVIDADGNELTPRSAQQRQVLTLLAAHQPAPVPIDALEDLLWPDGAPSPNALQALVSKLRKVVRPASIDGDALGYALCGATTDVEEFDRRSAAGRWADAEELVRGRPLDDLGDAPVALALRARLSGIEQTVRTRRLESAVDDSPTDALPELRELTIAEPLVEAWWGLLMLAEYRSGRAADALRTYQRARATLADQLGIDPGPELQALEARILAHDPSLTVDDRTERRETRRPGLPARLNSFVGRDSEIASLGVALESHRLITLTGPGGAGKTSTAVELARRTSPDRARWADLAPLDDHDSIVRVLTRAVGLPESDQRVPGTAASRTEGLDRVIDVLGASEAVLVVDNCEHVLEAIAPIVHRLLVECPYLRIVATSREPLGVPGEHLFALPPLPPSESVQLFVERALDHGATAESVADRALVHTLCVRLDGLPLAIELAAARLRTMTVADLVEGLDDRFALLSHGSRTVRPRQRTLRAVVDWSHDLLDPVEQVVFRRLAAFVGGCPADGARAVCAGASRAPVLGSDGVDARAVGEALDRLVDKSLVVAVTGPNGTRFDLLETLDAYARERLVEADELEPTLVRHAQFFADLIEPALRGLIGPEQEAWFDLLGRERQNIEAALNTALARDDAQLALELTAPLGWYFFMTGELDVGGNTLADALACSGPTEPELRALATGLHGWLLANGPHIERAVAITSDAVGMLDRVGDPWVRAMISNTHAMAMFFAGRISAAEQMFPDIQLASRESNDPWVIAITELVAGELKQFRGDSVGAERALLEAARLFDEVGDRFAYALTITEASEIAEQFGHYDRAAEMLAQGIAIAEDVGFSSHPTAMRARLGNIEILRGNLDVAQRLHRSLVEDSDAAGVPWLQAMARFGLSMIARRRGQFDEAREHLDVAWAIPRAQSVPYLRSLLLVGYGYLCDQLGDFAEALEHQLAALHATERLDNPRATAYALEGIAGALALSGDDGLHRLGARLLGHCDALRRGVGVAMPAPERFDVDRAEARLRELLGDAFDSEFTTGAAMTTPEVVDLLAAVGVPS